MLWTFLCCHNRPTRMPIWMWIITFWFMIDSNSRSLHTPRVPLWCVLSPSALDPMCDCPAPSPRHVSSPLTDPPFTIQITLTRSCQMLVRNLHKSSRVERHSCRCRRPIAAPVCCCSSQERWRPSWPLSACSLPCSARRPRTTSIRSRSCGPNGPRAFLS